MTLSTLTQRLVGLAMLLAFVGLAPAVNAQVTALAEDFEDETVTYTTTLPEFSDGSTDFFTRTDGSNINAGYEVTGFSGSSYFAAQDIDDGGANESTQSMTFSGLDIEGLTDLEVSFSLAEDQASNGDEDWDSTDYFRVYASVYDVAVEGRQRGGEVLIFAVESDPVDLDNPDGTNTEPRVDTDFDGWGDGTALTPEFAAFMASIPGTGERLDLRIEFSLNAGDEDIAIDDVMVVGTSDEVEPEPIACADGAPISYNPLFLDTDGLGSSVGEFVVLDTFGFDDIDLSTCSVAVFDPFTELVTYSVSPDKVVFSNRAVTRTARGTNQILFGAQLSTGDPFPENTLPDGPGAIVLVEGELAVGASVSDALDKLITGMVYRAEDDVLAVYSDFNATETSTEDFLAAIASLSQSVANEDEANGIDLAVTAAPNPLRDRTTVAFGVAEAADVRVAVYDALGREVALLAEAPYAAGRHEVTFEANDLPAGVYVIRAVVGAEARTSRVTLAR